MANVTVSTPVNMNDQQVFFGNVQTANNNRIVIQSGDLRAIYEGTFGYDAAGNVFGTLESYRFTINGQEQFRATDIGVDANDIYRQIQIFNDAEAAIRIALQFDDRFEGSSGNDVIFTDNGNDTIFARGGDDQVDGESGADRIYGASGSDRLYGGPNNDLLIGGPGADQLNGGSGFDTVSYANAPGSVFVHLGFGIARGSDGPDSITDVESIRGSGEADTLVGNIEGNVIRGLGGDDLIAGGRGPDLIDGGRGNDTVQYSNAASGVFVHLGVGIGRGGDGADTVRNIENAMGSVHSDHLVGSSGGNRLMGSDGDDFLNARAGADRIDGGSGSDSAAFNRADAGVFVHLGAGIARGGDGPDTLVSIEKALGSRFDDTIVGTDGSNTLRGRAGDDQIRGDGGRDFLFGDFGQDNFVFNDGHGNDVVGDAEQGDRFDLRGVTGFDSFSDVQNALSGTASRSVIDTGADSSITLVGIGVNDLDSGDFLL